MAAPAGPRPGWSRRAQYGQFFGFLAVIFGVVVGLIMLALSLAAPQSFERIRGGALDITGPIGGSLTGVKATVNGVISGAGDYWDAARQNGRLKRDNQAMRRRMVEAKAILLDNHQLKATLGLSQTSGEIIAVGRVIGSSFNSPRRFAILSVGSGNGVKIGMPVRAPDGLVGRIVDTGTSASRVLLVSDRANIVPARLLRGGIPVIVQGRGDGTVDVRPLEVGRNPFKRGDILVTSGTGGLYPPLVPIARIVKLDDDGAIALPLADPATTSYAVVVPQFEPAAIIAEIAPADTDSP